MRVAGRYLQIYAVFLFPTIDMVFVDSGGPNEMPHSAAFYLCIRYLPKYPVKGFWSYKGLQYKPCHVVSNNVVIWQV